MKRKAVNPRVLETDNAALEEVIRLCTAEKSKENINRLMEAVKKGRYLVPARLPEDTDPAIRELMRRNMPFPDGKSPAVQPILMKNPQGESYVPGYTGKDAFPEDAEFEVILNVGIEQMLEIAAMPDVDGIILNPYTDRLILHGPFLSALSDVLAGKTPGKTTREVKMTPEEFAHFARTNVERGMLPQAAYADPDAFFEDLEEKQGRYLYEWYVKPFGDKIPNPYREGDFSVMLMDISAHRRIASLDLPAPKTAGDASAIYVVYDPAERQMEYYLFEKSPQDSGIRFCEVTKGNLYRAIEEDARISSELYYLIDYLDNKQGGR